MADKPVLWMLYDWEYTNPVSGKWDYARTPERAENLIKNGFKLTPVYIPSVPIDALNFVNEEALDKAAREGYAVRCKTNAPRHLEVYAAPYVMERQLEDARVIVASYLKALKS